jgi:riboflavin-specific deaminase-like protein
MMRSLDIAAESLAEIASAPPERPFVVAQLGQSLDGRIATPAGHSRWINGEAALDHLHGLRAAVDAVVVGVGTVVADDPQLTVRRNGGTHPARVVIDPSGRAPWGAKCFADDGVRRFCVMAGTAVLPHGVEAIIVPATDGAMAPADIVATLFARGMRRILIEGGAATVSRFIDAGMVDRLQMLIAPVIIGSGPQGLNLAPIVSMGEAMRPRARMHVFPGGDVLFDCDLRMGV